MEYFQKIAWYFDTMPFLCKGSQEVMDSLRLVRDHQWVLQRELKHVTFAGIFSTGKSTLINALIAAPLLPTHTNRTTGTVTRIQCADLPQAAIWRRTQAGFDKQEISIDDIKQYVQLDLSGVNLVVSQEIEFMTVGIPFPTSLNTCVLVDTPGILDNEMLTQRTYRELEQTDLAVVVLQASKALSSPERKFIEKVNELLAGNIVFIINRLNTVEQEERGDLIEYIQEGLEGLGNTLVGHPNVFVVHTDTDSVFDGNTAHLKQIKQGITEFEQWLGSFMTSHESQQMAFRSRAKTLDYYLDKVTESVQVQLEEDREILQTEQERINQEYEFKLEQYVRLNQEIEQRLKLFKIKVASYDAAFVGDCETRTQELINSDSNWRKKLNESLNASVDAYVKNLKESAREATSGFLKPWPAFVLPNAIKDLKMLARNDNSAKWGAVAGGAIGIFFGDPGIIAPAIGAGIGSWASKIFLGVDVKAETLASLRIAAGEVHSALKKDSNKYLMTITRLMKGLVLKPKLRLNKKITKAQRDVAQYEEVENWCESFKKALQDLRKEVPCEL